ncbi:neutral zinc metallopeptidase [Pseudonocardia sp. CA-142604]|uniref:neutral zinc metallopeptidase n=1 Tax=Pseudonocardia sp. CA-142604 TaxID=3240024 RepID=UPI003D8B3E36
MRVPSRQRPPAAALLAVALSVLVAGCTQAVPGHARPAPQHPAASVAATPGSLPATGDVTADATAALQEIWRSAFPAAFGRAWTDIARFEPVHTANAAAPAPTCVDRVADLVGQAFYCPAADAVVWDADTLVPDLHRRFGSAGVTVALAHEVGHAVQTRLGIDEAQSREPRRYPAILLETMADCYAGAAFAQPGLESVGGLATDAPVADDALLALVGFRDPLGVEPGDDSAHGNAFDRVSAFQDGFRDGAARCAAMTTENRVFTQRRFGSAADRARGGDLPLPLLLDAVQHDAVGWFGALAPGRNVPPLNGAVCPVHGGTAQGPVLFCPADGGLSIDRSALAAVHREVGDFAGVTLVASRYGVAVLGALGLATEGPAAGAAAVCLAGAYTAALMEPGRGFTLSPGDLDEAVQVLLTHDWAARDAEGDVDSAEHGFERVARFRAGLLDGPGSCLPHR